MPRASRAASSACTAHVHLQPDVIGESSTDQTERRNHERKMPVYDSSCIPANSRMRALSDSPRGQARDCVNAAYVEARGQS